MAGKYPALLLYMLKVHSIETFGTHEGPGIRLVVFVQGCNFRCLYCHNPDSQDITGEAREMTSEEIIELLNRQKEYFKNKGGLTVSGGEPTLQVRGMIDLFQKVKEAGFNTVLDTNGSIVSSKVSELYALTDLVLLDVKHINPDLHKKITGHSNESVLHNAKLREESGKPMWLRYVLVPGYSNQEEYLYIWCEHFKNYKQVEIDITRPTPTERNV